jgi:hypothetical protein
LRVKSGKQRKQINHYFVCFWNILTHRHPWHPSNLLTSVPIVLNYLFFWLA